MPGKWPVAAVAILLAAGCGDNPLKGDDLHAVAMRFVRAVAEGNGSAACALLTAAGQRDMTAYPARYSSPTGHSCVDVVDAMPGRPDIAAWRAMAGGKIEVASRNTGLDTRDFWVVFTLRGVTYRARGGAGKTLLGAVRIEQPPFPLERAETRRP